jgi:heme A synthase
MGACSWSAPISLALMHQAMAMLALPAATAHVALVADSRVPLEVIPLASAASEK